MIFIFQKRNLRLTNVHKASRWQRVKQYTAWITLCIYFVDKGPVCPFHCEKQFKSKVIKNFKTVQAVN